MADKKIKDFTGKEAIHSTLGRVYVKGAPKGARTTLFITCIDRGPGWDEVSQTYKGTRRIFTDPNTGEKSISWSRGQNYQYGFEDEVHIDSLTLIDEDNGESDQ